LKNGVGSCGTSWKITSAQILVRTSPLRQKSDVCDGHQWHKETRDQREWETLHERRAHRSWKSRPHVKRPPKNGVHKIGDADQIPGKKHFAETKPIIGHAPRRDPGGGH